MNEGMSSDRAHPETAPLSVAEAGRLLVELCRLQRGALAGLPMEGDADAHARNELQATLEDRLERWWYYQSTDADRQVLEQLGADFNVLDDCLAGARQPDVLMGQAQHWRDRGFLEAADDFLQSYDVLTKAKGSDMAAKKRGRGRPPLGESKLQIGLCVRLTALDRKKLETCCLWRKQTPSAWLREALARDLAEYVRSTSGTSPTALPDPDAAEP